MSFGKWNVVCIRVTFVSLNLRWGVPDRAEIILTGKYSYENNKNYFQWLGINETNCHSRAIFLKFIRSRFEIVTLDRINYRFIWFLDTNLRHSFPSRDVKGRVIFRAHLCPVFHFSDVAKPCQDSVNKTTDSKNKILLVEGKWRERERGLWG